MIGDRQLTRDDLPFPLDRPVNGQDILALLQQLVQPLWSHAACGGEFFIGQVTSPPAGKPKQIEVTLPSGDVFFAWHDARLIPTVGMVVYGLRNTTQALAIGSLA